MLVFLFFYLYFSLNSCYDIDPHKSETEVEKFRFGDYDFQFYSKDANWDEAYTICKAKHSRLAVVNTLERAKFLADALSQTKVGFEDVWIGGRFLSDRWRWAATGKTFSRITKNFPPWLNYPTQRGKECLALDRRNHREPIFVEKKCSIIRAFICEISVSQSLDNVPEIANEIKINNSQYFLYHARVTWEEAVAFCKQTETRLAVVPDLRTAKALVGIMQRTRPAFENMWIGARRSLMGWEWVSTEGSLGNETNGYPPWKFGAPIDNTKSCAILDHHPCHTPIHAIFQNSIPHQCEEPYFIEEECKLKKDFMCEYAVETDVKQIRQYQITVDQITYIFFKDKKTWVDALVVCENFSMNLATPETDRQWDLIINYMGDIQYEFDHTWIGGRWIPHEWVWLNNRSIPQLSNTTYPPWCPSLPIHEDDGDCLNLDRDFHNAAVIYGYNCSALQQFVCQFDNLDAIEAPDPSTANEYDRKDKKSDHFAAEWECKKNGSYLAIINNMKSAQELAVLLPRDTLVWIGGERRGNVWRWTQTKEIIPDIISENSYPPWETSVTILGERMCLAMKSGYRDQPYFVEKPCDTKLQFVCQFESKELPQPDVIIEFNSIKHYFYKKLATWPEAMSTCRAGDFYLVNVPNLDLANFLIQGIGNSTSLWTSGKESLPGSWSWVTSGLKLPEKIKAGYPPWLNNTIPKDESVECLLLESKQQKPIFKTENCTKRHSFVCIDKIFVYDTSDVPLDNITINIKDVISSITRAKTACTESGKSVINFARVNQTQLLNILKSENVKATWVDVVHNSDGKWVYADTLQEFKTNIEFPDKNNHTINDPKSCLILHLISEKDENNKTAEKLLLKPALCSDFSRIVCMSNETKKTDPPRVEKMLQENTTLTAVLEAANAVASNLLCNDIRSEIVQPMFMDAAIAFFKNLTEGYTKFWIDARFINGSWNPWSYSRRINNVTYLPPIPPTVEYDNGTTAFENTCLIYNRELDALEAANCSKKYNVVCQRVKVKCEPRKTLGTLKWSPERCTKGRLNISTICKASCSNTHNLVGSELYVCVKGKWTPSGEPSCQTNYNQGKNLLKVVKFKTEETVSSFLFVIDHGLGTKKGLERTNYEKALQFAKNLANTVALSKKRRVAIELYSYKAQMIDLMENNNCYLIYTIDTLIRSGKLSRKRPNYYNAFLVAEQEFFNKTAYKGAAFIFFFAMRPDAGPIQKRNEVINRLKAAGTTIVIITAGDEIKRSQLEEIVSTRNNGIQLYSFNTFKGMEAAAKVLKKESIVSSGVCAAKDWV